MHFIQQIGSYAGLLAIPGLALLSGLYFSQARDVKRLREWAGRAPERAADAQRPARAAPPPPPERTAATAERTAVAPATEGALTAPPAPATAAARGRPPAAAATAVAQPPARGVPDPAAGASSPPSRRILPPPGDPAYRDPEPRRINPRTLVIAAAALVAVVVIALVVSQLGGGSSSTSPQQQPAAGPAAASVPTVPGQVRVAVENATMIPGLGAKLGGRVQSAGFQLGNVDNATQKQRPTTVVMYANGAQAAAALVQRKLGIASIQPADPGSVARAGGAPVMIVVGADQNTGPTAAP